MAIIVPTLETEEDIATYSNHAPSYEEVDKLYIVKFPEEVTSNRVVVDIALLGGDPNLFNPSEYTSNRVRPESLFILNKEPVRLSYTEINSPTDPEIVNIGDEDPEPYTRRVGMVDWDIIKDPVITADPEKGKGDEEIPVNPLPLPTNDPLKIDPEMEGVCVKFIIDEETVNDPVMT